MRYVTLEVCALASHLQVFFFQSEWGVKSLRTGGGGVKMYFCGRSVFVCVCGGRGVGGGGLGQCPLHAMFPIFN